MTYLRVTEHFDAPIEKVFDRALDLERYPEWNVNYIEVKDTTGPPYEAGTKFHAVMKLLGRRVEGDGEIIELVRPTLLKTTGSSTPDTFINYTVRFTKAGTGTDVEIESEYKLPAGIFGEVADKVFVERAVERDIRHSLENFKAFLTLHEPVLV